MTKRTTRIWLVTKKTTQTLCRGGHVYLCDRRKEMSLVYRIDVDDIEDNDDSYHTHDEEQCVSNQFSALLGI